MEPAIHQVSLGWAENAPEQYVYNVPDAYEQDPELIRAELMFFNTPQSQAFSGEAYFALKNVQEQCQVDYQKFCTKSYMTFGDTQMIMEKIFSSTLPFLMSRRLHETGNSRIPSEHSGRQLLEYLRSFYVPKKSEEAPKALNTEIKPELKEKQQERLRDHREHATGAHSHVMRGDNAKLAHAMKMEAANEKLEAKAQRKLRSSSVEPPMMISEKLQSAILMPRKTKSMVDADSAVTAVGSMADNLAPADTAVVDQVTPMNPVIMIDPPLGLDVDVITVEDGFPSLGARTRPEPELPFGVPILAHPVENQVAYPEPGVIIFTADEALSTNTLVDPLPMNGLARSLAERPPGRHGSAPPPPPPPPRRRDDDADAPANSSPGYPGDKPRPDKPSPPPPPRDGHDHHHHDHDSDSDEDDDEDDVDARHRRHHHGEHAHGLEDSFFPGALGYGASGDMCLYDNVQNLSPPCASAIGDVYSLRQQYWNSYNNAQAAQSHHHPAVGLFFVGLLLVVLVKRMMHVPRHRHVHKFLSALNEHPELKSQLESQLNMEVPLPRKALCCGGSRNSFCRRLFFAVGFLVFAFVTSIFIAVTSLEMTAGIVDGMESHADGDAPPVSGFVILLILGVIVVAQLVLLRMLMRTVGGFWRRNCGATIDDETNQGDHNDSSSSSSNNNNNSTAGSGGLQVELQRLTTLPVSFYREYVSPRVSSFFATRAATSEGYAPLRAGGDEEREMIPVGRQAVASSSSHGGAQQQYAVYTGVPINPHNVVRVAARPVSAVNLV